MGGNSNSHDQVVYAHSSRLEDGLGEEAREADEAQEDHDEGGRDGAIVVEALERRVHGRGGRGRPEGRWRPQTR